MTTKELIRAEIERRIKELEEQIVDIYDSKAVLRKDELQRLLSFLDTLPDEPVTDCHDLDEAAHNYSESDEPLYSPGHRFHWDNDSLFGKQIETTFKAGAKWQKKQDELLSKITEEHLEGLRWIIRTGIITQPRPYHKYCKDLLQLLESYKNEI